jgi:hypothetical protein
MSNKLTRKSLAFGAMVALASSVIAGAPAQAAGEVVFAPTTGTSYNTFVTEQISLNASLAPGQVAGNISQLKYKVDSAVASSVWINTGNTVVAPVVGGVASTTSFVVAASGASSTLPNIITLKLAVADATTATTSVTVTAFLDSNSDNLLTAGEFEQARTVKFVKYSEVVPTVTLTTPAAGDQALKATATLADINVEQLGYTAADKGNVDVAFTATGTSTAITTTRATGTFTSSAVTALVATNVVTAQATYRTIALGTAVTATVAARTIATVEGAVVVGPNAIAGNARPNSAFAVKGTVKNSATPAVGVAGVPVTATLTTQATLGTGITLSVNGTVYSTNASLTALSLVLTSDANGEVLVNLIPVGFTGTQNVVVTFNSQNLTPAVVTVAQQALAYTMVDSQDDTASANRAVARGGSVSFNLEVKDQYGVAISGASRIATTVSGGTTIATAYTAVADGKATVTVKDGQTTTSNPNTILFVLETQNSATLNWAPSAFTGFGTGTPVALNSVAVSVSATAPGFTNAPAPATGTKFTGIVSPVALASVTGATANGVSLLNNVTGLSTVNPGQRVTISGTGLLFRVGSKNYNDTVTLFSGALGAFAVTVYGTKAGDSVVTLVTGTTTATATITFAAGPVALVTVDAPAQAQVGQAMDVVVTTTDLWGNPKGSVVDTAALNEGNVVLSSTGTGYFANTAPVTNATTGKATVKYIVGTADIGTAFLSATLDLATDVTAARSVEFGLTDGDVLAGGKRIFVSAEFAKGRTVSVSVNGKRIYSKVQTTDNAVELAFTQRRAGTYTVTVRISGGITFTERVTVG